jgi:hypothetical protein
MKTRKTDIRLVCIAYTRNDTDIVGTYATVFMRDGESWVEGANRAVKRKFKSTGLTLHWVREVTLMGEKGAWGVRYRTAVMHNMYWRQIGEAVIDVPADLTEFT